MDDSASGNVHGLLIFQRRCSMPEAKSVRLAQRTGRIAEIGHRPRSRYGIRAVLQPAVQQYCSCTYRRPHRTDGQLGELQLTGCGSVIR